MRGFLGVRKRWLVALLGVMLVAASCGGDDGEATAPVAPEPVSPEPAPEPPPPPPEPE